MFDEYLNFDQPKPTKKKVVISESTAKVLQEEQVIIENVDETDSHKIAEEINTKSKKTRAKVKKDGSVEVKQSLNG